MKNVSVNSLPVQNFLGWSKAGTSFFSVSQRGGPKFFECQTGGDQNFFLKITERGDQNFFYVCQGGDQNFVMYAKGGDQKKLATGHHKQTAPPLPVKNDSSHESAMLKINGAWPKKTIYFAKVLIWRFYYHMYPSFTCILYKVQPSLVLAKRNSILLCLQSSQFY